MHAVMVYLMRRAFSAFVGRSFQQADGHGHAAVVAEGEMGGQAAAGHPFRRPARTSPELERMVAAFRTRVPFIDNDTVMYPHIEASVQFLRER